jgi:predicted small secreted protein
MRTRLVKNAISAHRRAAIPCCLSAVALAVALAGCGNTLSGAKQDVATDTQGVRNSATQAVTKAKDSAAAVAIKAKDSAAVVAEKAKDSASVVAAKAQASAQGVVEKTRAVGAEIKSAPENADAAVVVTPEVKTAIIRDPVLDDPHNAIDVNSRDQAVHLTGHVASSLMKRRAEEDAQLVLSKRHPDYHVVDELTVQAAQP